MAGAWPPQPTQVDALPLSHSEYERYGRQMILPGFGGLPAQLKLKSSRVLVVGAGGLGCPAVQYLALGGIGHITVVDHDVVERSNLARQVLHDESRLGISKAESIRVAVEALNPHVTVKPVVEQFTPQNALALVSSHDVVLDCTDNPLTRYLINDAAVLCGKAVVSGAAQGLEGQLVVLHKELGEQTASSSSSSSSSRGPCYRCLFPVAPRPQDVTDCSEGGILGTITGLVGTLQANETIKLLLEPIHQTRSTPSLLLASPMSDTGSSFRTIKIRPRRRDCRACGDDDVLAEKGLRHIASLEDEDYLSFCGLRAPLGEDDSIHALNVRQLASLPKPPDLVVDVRTEEEFSIVQLPPGIKTINVPWPSIRRDPQASLSIIKSALGDVAAPAEVPVVCRRGNDSRLAVAALAALEDGSSQQRLRFVDVTGGLTAWSKDVDAGMPMY